MGSPGRVVPVMYLIAFRRLPGRPAEPRRWSIVVVLTTTMEHCRGWAGPVPGRGLGPVMRGWLVRTVRRTAASRRALPLVCPPGRVPAAGRGRFVWLKRFSAGG